MNRTLLCLCLVLSFACGNSAGRARLEPADVLADPEPAPAEDEPAEPTVPADFQISRGGGPANRGWIRNSSVEYVRIEPSPERPGEFDIVRTEARTDDMGREGEATEIGREPASAEAIEALYTLVVERRDELDQPCFDRTIMDGGSTSFYGRVSGAEFRFSCTNATTPAFQALSQAFAEATSPDA